MFGHRVRPGQGGRQADAPWRRPLRLDQQGGPGGATSSDEESFDAQAGQHFWSLRCLYIFYFGVLQLRGVATLSPTALARVVHLPVAIRDDSSEAQIRIVRNSRVRREKFQLYDDAESDDAMLDPRQTRHPRSTNTILASACLPCRPRSATRSHAVSFGRSTARSGQSSLRRVSGQSSLRRAR